MARKEIDVNKITGARNHFYSMTINLKISQKFQLNLNNGNVQDQNTLKF